MKKLIFTSFFALLLGAASVLTAQNRQPDYLGLPGDNLNLFAVMNLFQESETLEAFERSLNDPETMINNLDLNGDNYVDYIMVFDYQEDNLHTIVLRVALNQNEYQDVAVFTVERFRDGTVQVQLIGDEALYGPNYIIEPVYAERPNPGYRGNIRNSGTETVVNNYHRPAQWPVIVYMSRPVYRPWRSAWVWGYHPVWWNPWTPHYWHFYFGYHYHWHAHYYAHFHMWSYPRCHRFRTVYHTRIRHYSPTVIVNINNGDFRRTYSRPELVNQGEEHFAQRHPGRYGTAPGNKSASEALQQRHGEISAQQPNNPTSRGTNQARVAPAVETNRPGRNQSTPQAVTAPRQNPAVNRAGDGSANRQTIINRSEPQNQRVTPPGQRAQQPNNRAVQTQTPERNRPVAQPQRAPDRRPQTGSQTRPTRQAVSTPARQRPSSNERPAVTAPARQNNPAPARNVSPPAQRQNNNRATQNNRSNVSRSTQSRPSQPAVSSQPSRAPERQAPQTRPARNTNNRNANTPSVGRVSSPDKNSVEQKNSRNSDRK